MAEVKNPEIRKLAEERKAKLQESFASIRNYTEPLKAQFDPWMSDLKDLQKYLSNDLTIAGVDAAKGQFAKTRADGTEVQKSMDGLVAEINTIAAALTPAKVRQRLHDYRYHGTFLFTARCHSSLAPRRRHWPRAHLRADPRVGDGLQRHQREQVRFPVGLPLAGPSHAERPSVAGGAARNQPLSSAGPIQPNSPRRSTNVQSPNC